MGKKDFVAQASNALVESSTLIFVWVEELNNEFKDCCFTVFFMAMGYISSFFKTFASIGFRTKTINIY
jgi:hypothetical protein